jgi:amino acid adenylation domain-containing protein
MVIGLLGILKAGGAYVPLDPNYPAERREFILADAQVSVLLAQRNLFEDGGSRIDDSNSRSSILDRRIQRICLDRDCELIAGESDLNPENITTADNLAYVIYTSGSTGQPKGVTIEHRNTVGFLSWVHSTFTPEELSGVLAATSICFDLSVFEIFAPLTCGGMVILAENPLALATIQNRARVSLLNTVPSAMNELLRLGAIPASVRVINLAGEPLRPELVRRIYESTSVHKVHDLYGPSECTTYSTWAYRSAEGPQTIGRPIANTRVYILDPYLNPAPIGVVGEIYIGGDGVARGYLNQPKLTAERFTYHSFDGEPAQRLYRTGDLARYLPDGNIEFLGRTDNQVKIRGYRIELGEIEAVLTQNPAVRESAVITREDRAGDKQLVAYMVPKESAPAASELRTFLKAKLPEYMVPSAFVVLDSLPLTPNGKVDRQALPEPDRGSADLEQVYVAPRNASEQAIADIWAEILGVKRIGVHDNFFERGGHSLKATQIVSRLRKMFGSEIPLRYMFQFPTIADLAAVIDSTTQTQSNDEKLDGLLTEIEAMTEIEAQRLVDKSIGSKVSD